MRSYQGAVLVVACLLNSAVARAQTETPTPVLAPPPSTSTPSAPIAPGDPTANALHKGVWSLSFEIPTGGSPWLEQSVGAWYMLSHRVNLGLNFDLNIDPEQGPATVTTTANGTVVSDTFVDVSFIIAPAIKYYFTTSGPVTPYVVGQLRAGFQRGTISASDTGGNTAGVLSLAGGFGLEVFPWRFLSLGGNVGVNLDLLRPAAAQRSAALQTVTSSIYATAYFE